MRLILVEIIHGYLLPNTYQGLLGGTSSSFFEITKAALLLSIYPALFVPSNFIKKTHLINTYFEFLKWLIENYNALNKILILDRNPHTNQCFFD